MCIVADSTKIMNLRQYISYQRQRKRNINNVLLLSLLLLRKKKQKRPRRLWARDIFLNRKNQGAYHNLLNEMMLTDSEKYFNYLRMSSDSFQNLLQLVGEQITKTYCVREPISPGERLSVTLRYLASGDSMISLSYAFRIAPCTVSMIIKETCDAIWDCLNDKVLLTPKTESWMQIAQDFEAKWQLPHCVGAIDGKHVTMQAPVRSGSSFFNFKGAHSVVLLALCDANYKFTLVDIGAQGRHSDGGILKNSEIGKLIITDRIKFPAPSVLGTEEEINYYIVGDEAFPLTTCIMRPYAGRFLMQNKRIFNYRLSRGRRMIENVFGILAQRWRIYRKPIIASIPTVEAVIKATVCLHNYVMMSDSKTGSEKRYFTLNSVDRETNDGEIIEADWRNEDSANGLLPIRRTSSNRYGRAAENMRDLLCGYFVGEGSVHFQWNK